MQPPTPFKWVRCYDIDGEVEDDRFAFCPTHGRRYSYMTRGEKGPWHLFLVEGDELALLVSEGGDRGG